jgi:Holliday junction resolvasome RuvABC DNA-binding subunit
VLELKEKLGTVGESEEPTPLSPKPHLVAREALVELGYSIPEAEEALADTDPDATPEERVRQALKRAA